MFVVTARIEIKDGINASEIAEVIVKEVAQREHAVEDWVVNVDPVAHSKDS